MVNTYITASSSTEAEESGRVDEDKAPQHLLYNYIHIAYKMSTISDPNTHSELEITVSHWLYEFSSEKFSF